jgi:hypothetical protein
MSSDLPVVHGQPVHSLETITAKLKEDPRNIDAAIAILGSTDFFHNSDNFTHLKLFQFVTGIELRTGRQRWSPKSLQHPNAIKLFQKDCERLGLKSPLEIGFNLAVATWFRLSPLLSDNYEPPNLKKEREQRKVKTIKLESVIIDALKGKGVKFIFNGKYYWVPRSIVKYSYEDETLEVPLWYARKENLL